jgi:hypothetical protein
MVSREIYINRFSKMLLGAFAKLRKAIIISVMSVGLQVRME